VHSLDSGFHSLDSGFRSLDSGFHYLDSGFQIGRGFQIPENWPRIRILDSSDVWILDSTVWIADCKAIISRILHSWIYLTWGEWFMSNDFNKVKISRELNKI
jgi:hypothetical protein